MCLCVWHFLFRGRCQGHLLATRCTGHQTRLGDQSIGVPCRAQFSIISEVRHQKNLSNVLFFIQDADQRFRNELSGMVQFVPKDLEDERVRHSDPAFGGPDVGIRPVLPSI